MAVTEEGAVVEDFMEDTAVVDVEAAVMEDMDTEVMEDTEIFMEDFLTGINTI